MNVNPTPGYCVTALASIYEVTNLEYCDDG
jgi:hypothetical protein